MRSNILFTMFRDASGIDLSAFELRHLRYFVAVAEELHFGRAAKRLGIAQPPLSQQIRQLEARLDVPLFTRTSRQVALTAAGEALLRGARRALAEVGLAAAAARRAATGETDALRIAYTDSAALSVLPGAIQRFRSALPSVHLDLVEGSTAAQIDAVARDLVDLAVVRGPIVQPSLRTEVVLREPFLLHYYAGFGVKEIAAQLKKPEGTIKADLYHARAKLKEALAEREARRATGPHPVQGRGNAAGTPGNEGRGKRRGWGRTDAS